MNSRGPGLGPQEALSDDPLISITGLSSGPASPPPPSLLSCPHCPCIFPPPFIVVAPRGLKLPTRPSNDGISLRDRPYPSHSLHPSCSKSLELPLECDRVALGGSRLDPDRPIVFSSTVWLKSEERYARPSLCAYVCVCMCVCMRDRMLNVQTILIPSTQSLAYARLQRRTEVGCKSLQVMNKNYELIASRILFFYFRNFFYTSVHKFSIISSKLQYTLSGGNFVFSAAIFPSNYPHEVLATPYRISLPRRLRFHGHWAGSFSCVRVFMCVCTCARVTEPPLLIFILQVTPENASFDRTLLFSCRDARSCPRVAAGSSASNCFDGCSDSSRLNKIQATSLPRKELSV